MKKRILSILSKLGGLSMSFLLLLTFATNAVTTKVNAQEDSKLLLHYDFNDVDKENNDRTIYDKSGNGFNGTMVGSTTSIIQNGYSGGALSLIGATDNEMANRVDSYVKLPENLFEGLKEVTVSTWVYFKHDPTNYWSRVFDIGVGTNAYMFVCKGGRASYGATSGIFADIDAPVYSDYVWTNITVTYSRNAFRYYINGVLFDENLSNLPELSCIARTTCAYIGKSQYAADTCLTADIDEFKIYNKALTQKEICSEMADVMGDEECVKWAANGLELGTLTGIRKDINLPTVGLFDTNITWQSSDTNVISNEGKIAEFSTGVRKTTIMATITKNNVSIQKSFDVSVCGTEEHSYFVDIDADNFGVEISDVFQAGFFEDTITLDGGLNAQLIKNNSFEFDNQTEGWLIEGAYSVSKVNPLNENNTHYLSFNGKAYNTGFYNKLSVNSNKEYEFSVFARGTGKLRVYIVDNSNNALSNVLEFGVNDKFTKYSGKLLPNTSLSGARLVIQTTDGHYADIDYAELYPISSFNGIDNIFNEDLVKYIADMGIKALRFPGGCVMEGTSTDGTTLQSYNNWKYGLGNKEERLIVKNVWGGYQSNQIGYFEYLLLCEALGCEAIPVVNAGMSCQIKGNAYTANDTTYYCPLSLMRETFIQDAIDLIEFCNGDETTTYGNYRIMMGHKEPFNLKYLAIGNENFGSEYLTRYEMFKDVIGELYPEITLVSAAGPWAEGEYFDQAFDEFNSDAKYDGDVIDEHYYQTSEWYIENLDRYTSYLRDGNDIYLGEFAVKNSDGKSTLYTSLVEAAYMMGMVKNADVVRMYSYAPMFQCADQSIWSPALIWYSGNMSYASASYYNQVAFNNNTGNVVVDSTLTSNNFNSITGTVFMGAYCTEVDYEDMVITDSNTGEVIYQNDFSAPLWSWEGPVVNDGAEFGFYNAYDKSVSPVPHWFIDYGEGTVKTVANTRLGDKTDISAMLDTRFVYKNGYDLSDYTLVVNAKKFSGSEGFLIGFGCKDMSNYYQFNFGGFNNTRIVLEKHWNGTYGVVDEYQCEGLVCETGKSYQIKIVVKNQTIKCYVNDVLYIEYTEPEKNVVTETTYDMETNELIVKAVNLTELDQLIKVNISDVEIGTSVKKITLLGDNKDATNSFGNPNAVRIEYEDVKIPGPSFSYVLDAYTMVIYRIPVSYASISLSGDDVIKIGESREINVSLKSTLGVESITLSNNEIATIEGNKVTALKEGVCEIVVTLEGGITYKYPITIMNYVKDVVIRTPIKLEYFVGEDLEGVEVYEIYADGTEVKVNDFEVIGFDKNQVGTQNVTVQYKEQTVSFEVIVTEKELPKDPDDNSSTPSTEPSDDPIEQPSTPKRGCRGLGASALFGTLVLLASVLFVCKKNKNI